jgi:glycosyltransferase involved in cell wall biosynthesis
LDQNLRILHLDCTTGFGGQERDHLSEARGFLQKGHTYILGARTGTAFAREAGQAARTLELPLRNNLDLVSLSALRSFLQKEKIDVVVTTSYIDNWLGAMASFSLGKNRPLLIRQRHIMNSPKNLFPFHRLCDRLVVVSDALRIFFVESGLPFWHVVTIPRGSEFKSVNESGRDPRTIRADLKIPDSSPVLLQIGTFQRDKGHALMLDSLKNLWKINPDIVMIFLGTGPLFDDIVHRARNRFSEKFEKQLFFLGQMDPAPYFSIASVVVVPSVRESFSLVTLEAIGHGVPVVSYRVGGVPEIFNRTPGGKLVQPNNTRAFSKAVQDILSDKALQEKTKTEYSRKILGEFSLERCVERTESLYRWGLDRLRNGIIHQNPYLDDGGKADCFAGYVR